MCLRETHITHKKPTIYDVAERAGASISTVSRVLNNSPLVSDATARRVWDAVDELNYRPSSLARALAMNETRTIGLLVTDNMNPFFAELAYHIEAAGAEAGYSVILSNSDRDPAKEAEHVDVLIAKRVDGVIFMAVDSRDSSSVPSMELLVREQIPVVTFDRHYTGFDSVVLDNYRGGYDATRYLIDLGHARIACITGPGSVVGSAERVDGYRRALADAGLPVYLEMDRRRPLDLRKWSTGCARDL